MDITRKTFMDLLAAVHNICPEAKPGDEQGEDMMDTALRTAKLLFDLIEKGGKGHREGVVAVVRLLAEVSCARTRRLTRKAKQSGAGTATGTKKRTPVFSSRRGERPNCRPRRKRRTVPRWFVPAPSRTPSRD